MSSKRDSEGEKESEGRELGSCGPVSDDILGSHCRLMINEDMCYCLVFVCVSNQGYFIAWDEFKQEKVEA